MTGQNRVPNREGNSSPVWSSVCSCDEAERERGFTLLEVLVAMAIMTIGISSAILLFAAAASLQSQTVLVHRAADFASTIFSEIAAQLKSGVDLKKIAVKEAVHPDFPRFKYSVTIIPLDDFEDELFVCVDIFYLWRGERRSHRFSTVLLRYLGVDQIRPTSAPPR
ncbi:MAG: type II secretion system GspH family protein [Planctomycetota bacterium]|nr:type II secretion system GspH family protein [Planctomycetota bacterium]